MSGELRSSKDGTSIVVDAYETDCCHHTCPGLSVSENESKHACLILGQHLERFGFWSGNKDCKFQRCSSCITLCPDPDYVAVSEVPEFIPGNEYRFRYTTGKRSVHKCVYVEQDGWGRHVFRYGPGEHTEQSLMWWDAESTYMEWVI